MNLKFAGPLALLLLLLTESSPDARTLFTESSNHHQIVRLSFRSETVSVLAFVIVYAPVLSVRAGAGMIVSVSIDGKQSTGGYHYSFSDVQLTGNSVRMGKQRLTLNGNTLELDFRSRDLSVRVTLPELLSVSERPVSLAHNGETFFQVSRRAYSDGTGARILLYGKEVRTMGSSTVDSWSIADSVPDDLLRIRITTGRQRHPVFVAESLYSNRETAYIHFPVDSRHYRMRKKSGPRAPATWQYSESCTLSISPGRTEHTLNRRTMPSTSRLLGRYLGRHAVFVSFTSRTITRCGEENNFMDSETTVVTFQ